MIAQAHESTDSLDIHPEMLLPELFERYPTTRQVFDRYGLSGCGGHGGPVESIRFFARAHGVGESSLLAELRHATHAPQPSTPLAAPSLADSIYRRFFVGGILIVLTFGATWGAWLLWQIAFSHSFLGANSIQDVNAHGHAQIYGWVGLFIMGFAYQAFPRIWHTRLPVPRLAVLVFSAMASGIILRCIGMELHGLSNTALPLALLGGFLEIAAVLTFAVHILSTFRASGARLEPYVGFVIVALISFFAMSLLDVWHTYTTMSAQRLMELLWYIATYQAPLRDLQIHGLALCMILGVSLRMLPGLFDARPTPQRQAWLGLGLIGLAVVGEVVLFIAYRWTGQRLLATLLMIPWLMLVSGVVLVAWPWKLWRRFPQSDRSAKFIRFAYAWLALSLAMLLLFPVYQGLYASRYPHALTFSHAYYGAIRHAITVGFVSLMIMGFAAKVVPTLNGLDTRKLTGLWGPFLLVNLGCFLRVSLQVLTDWYPLSYAIIGFSGSLEVLGLTWWSIHLLRIMRQGKRQSLVDAPTAPRPDQIQPDHHVADVLTWYPATEAVFQQFGFNLINQPLLRRTVARTITLSQAAALHGVDPAKLVHSLNHTAHHDPRNC